LAETEENNIGLITKIALLADAVENVFPNGRGAVVFELKENDFETAKRELLVPNPNLEQFKVDMSGTEFIFLRDELLNVSEDTI
jgi:hypothetical protein